MNKKDNEKRDKKKKKHNKDKKEENDDIIQQEDSIIGEEESFIQQMEQSIIQKEESTLLGDIMSTTVSTGEESSTVLYGFDQEQCGEESTRESDRYSIPQ